MTDTPACQNCDSLGWVCENHANRPWRDGGSDRADACDCGAGMPCPECNDGPVPRDIAGSELLWSIHTGVPRAGGFEVIERNRREREGR